MASAVAFLRSLWSIRAWILLVLAFVLPCQLIIEATPVSKNLLLTQSIYFLSICFSFLLCLTNPSPLNNLCVLQADSILFITLKRRRVSYIGFDIFRGQLSSKHNVNNNVEMKETISRGSLHFMLTYRNHASDDRMSEHIKA